MHDEYDYVKYFDRFKTSEEEDALIEHIRKFKHEWRHYFREYFPDGSIREADMKFSCLRERVRRTPSLPYASVIRDAVKKGRGWNNERIEKQKLNN